jgi:hypothetical protein
MDLFARAGPFQVPVRLSVGRMMPNAACRYVQSSSPGRQGNVASRKDRRMSAVIRYSFCHQTSPSRFRNSITSSEDAGLQPYQVGSRSSYSAAKVITVFSISVTSGRTGTILSLDLEVKIRSPQCFRLAEAIEATQERKRLEILCS